MGADHRPKARTAMMRLLEICAGSLGQKCLLNTTRLDVEQVEVE
jgi:hypothetical protein